MIIWVFKILIQVNLYINFYFFSFPCITKSTVCFLEAWIIRTYICDHQCLRLAVKGVFQIMGQFTASEINAFGILILCFWNRDQLEYDSSKLSQGHIDFFGFVESQPDRTSSLLIFASCQVDKMHLAKIIFTLYL